MTRPVCEYRSIAELVAADEMGLTSAQTLIILLHAPYRLWDGD